MNGVELYQRLTTDYRCILEKATFFFDSDIKSIAEFLKQSGYLKIKYDGGRIMELIYNYSHKAYVYKLEDEWFICSFADYGSGEKHYKCDQVEGLIDCLKMYIGD